VIKGLVCSKKTETKTLENCIVACKKFLLVGFDFNIPPFLPSPLSSGVRDPVVSSM
jgi:hypothetical protein